MEEYIAVWILNLFSIPSHEYLEVCWISRCLETFQVSSISNLTPIWIESLFFCDFISIKLVKNIFSSQKLGLPWWVFHVQLKRMYVLLFGVRMLNKCYLCPLGWYEFHSSSFSTYYQIFYLIFLPIFDSVFETSTYNNECNCFFFHLYQLLLHIFWPSAVGYTLP